MQPDDIEKKKTDTSFNSPTSTEQYLASLSAYRDQIDQLSKLIHVTPPLEFLNDHEKLSNINLQIADVIDNLENLSGNLLGERFNKTAVLRHLNSARVELTIAATLVGDHDRQVQIMCFDHIVKCREYLNIAKSLMPSTTSS